jgi:hypothetical protein
MASQEEIEGKMKDEGITWDRVTQDNLEMKWWEGDELVGVWRKSSGGLFQLARKAQMPDREEIEEIVDREETLRELEEEEEWKRIKKTKEYSKNTILAEKDLLKKGLGTFPIISSGTRVKFKATIAFGSRVMTGTVMEPEYEGHGLVLRVDVDGHGEMYLHAGGTEYINKL